MLKKTYLILLLFFIGTTAQSQVLMSLIFGDKLNSEGLEFGLDGGYNFSGISTFGTDKKLGKFNLGFYFDITLKDKWHLDTGVLVKSTLGSAKLTDEDLTFLEVTPRPELGSYSQEIDYFIVPILVKYVFEKRIHVEAGPQLGYMREANVIFHHKNSEEEVYVRQENTDKVHKIDMGVSGGLGYKFSDNAGITLGVRYYYGLTDVYKNNSGTKNNSLFLNIHVPIGAKKKKNCNEVEQTSEQ